MSRRCSRLLVLRGSILFVRACPQNETVISSLYFKKTGVYPKKLWRRSWASSRSTLCCPDPCSTLPSFQSPKLNTSLFFPWSPVAWLCCRGTFCKRSTPGHCRVLFCKTKMNEDTWGSGGLFSVRKQGRRRIRNQQRRDP